MKNYKITALGKIIFIILAISLVITFFLYIQMFKLLLILIIFSYIIQLISIQSVKKRIREYEIANSNQLIEKEKKNIIKNEVNSIEVNSKKLSPISSNGDKNEDIELYFNDMKQKMDDRSAITNMDIEDEYENNNLFNDITMFIKRFMKFKKYHIDDFVLHNQFGIGKITNVEGLLIVSFMNDNYREEIEFEYNLNNRVPEVDLFKIPKDEDSRNYYYNYKTDISRELDSIVHKINEGLENIIVLSNIFLKVEQNGSFYDLILINDRVNVFNFNNNNITDIKVIEEIFSINDLKIKVENHNFKTYEDIKRVLLKEKVILNNELNFDMISDTEIKEEISKLIENNNIVDFNERKMFLELIN